MTAPTSSMVSGPALSLTWERPFALPMQWQNPDATPIDITGFSFAAKILWSNFEQDGAVTVDDAPNGKFTAAFNSVSQNASSSGPRLTVTVTDTIGSVWDFVFTINGSSP